MDFITAYGPKKRVIFNTAGPSLTHQSMKKECDINGIMARFEKTGILEHRNRFEGSYGDFTQTPNDYHESMNAVIAANDMFMTLPAKIRKRFQNDPGAYLDFVTDPDNIDEMVKLGLATKRPQEAVIDDPDPTPQKKPNGPSEAKKSGSDDKPSE